MRGSLFVRAALLGALALPGVVLAQSAEEEAGDISEVDKDRVGPLRERIRPVSGHVFLKSGRFEVTPSATVSVKDAFYTKYILGAALTFHASENLAVGGRFGYSIPIVSGAAQICTTEGRARSCRLPSMEELDEAHAPGKILLLGGVDVQWAPIYGKISLIAEKFLQFDLYALAGGSLVQYLGPQGSRGSPAITFGGDLGLGMRFFANRWATARVELRDLIYSETTPAGSSLRQQIMVHFGFSMFFPTTFQEN